MADNKQASRCLAWKQKKHLFKIFAGVGIFYLLSLAGTFAVVWQNASHKTEALLSFATTDLSDTVDEVVDAVLSNVGVALADHLGYAQPFTGDVMRQMAKDYNVDEINVVRRDGIIIGANDPTAENLDMSLYSDTTAQFMILTNGVTRIFSQKFRRSASEHSVVRKYLGIAFPEGNGYVQVGYDERRLAGQFRQTFGGLVSKWRIGETGFYVCADLDSAKIELPVRWYPGAVGKSLEEVGFKIEDIPESSDITFVQTIFGKRCFCRHFIYARHHMYSVLPAEEFYGPAIQSVMVAAAVLLIVFFVFGYVIGHMVAQHRRIAELRAMEDGRREKDLAMAKTIQLSSLPVEYPDEKDYSIYAYMLTAREVGGDFYDFYTLSNGKILFLVADVSGKGVPAALFMMRAKGIVRAAVSEKLDDLAGAVRLANENLSDHNDAEMFITAWIGVYDRASGEITFVNAGHNPPIIRRADRSVEWINERGGIALAAMGGVGYREHKISLAPGDSILLYTDGVTEAMNGKGEQYGNARLEARLKQVDSRYVSEVCCDVSRFVGGAEQSDDITIIALNRKIIAK